MHSAEQKKKAIETFARFDCSAADTIAELGYPSRVMLRNWRKEYQISGDEFLEREHHRPNYSDEEKRDAVDRYLEHGKSLARTIKAIGYPSSEVLDNWVDELDDMIGAILADTAPLLVQLKRVGAQTAAQLMVTVGTTPKGSGRKRPSPCSAASRPFPSRRGWRIGTGSTAAAIGRRTPRSASSP